MVEREDITAPVGCAPDRPLGMPRLQALVAGGCRFECGRLERVATVGLVADVELSGGFIAGGRYKDDPFRSGQWLETGLGAPPVIAAVIDHLLG